MHWRFEAIKAAISGRPDGIQRYFTRRMQSPPDRNTAEFLETYTKNPRLGPVTKIATDLSAVEGKLYRLHSNGEREEITEHPFLDFMRKPNPLPFMTRNALWKCLEQYLLIKGEGAAVIERDAGGYPAELWPVPPHWIIDIPRLDFPYYTLRSREGVQRQVEAADLFLMRQLNPMDPYGRGLGDAEPVADEIETDEYMAKWAKKFFFNDATPPVLLSAPGITRDEYERFQASWDNRHRGLGNAHHMGIVPRELTVQKLVDSQREMDFSESRKDLRDAVNAHFGVPPEILGIVENSNRATATQAKIIYAENVLTPRLLARQNAVNLQLLPAWGEQLLYEYDGIVPEDTEFRLQMSNAGLSGAAVMVDEWREQNGFDPLPNNAGRVLYIPFSSMPTPPDDLTENARENVEFVSKPEQDAPEPDLPPRQVTEDVAQLEVAKDIALNGAQVSSLVQIVRSVALGELDKSSAVEIITAAFPFDRAKAEQIIGGPAPSSAFIGVKGSARRKVQAAQRERLKLLSTQERATLQGLRRFFAAQSEEILEAVKSEHKSKSGDFWQRIQEMHGLAFDIEELRRIAQEALGELIDWGKQDEELARILTPLWENAFQIGAQSTEKAFGITAVRAPQLTDHLRKQGFGRIEGINATTRERLAASLAEGIEVGENMTSLSKRIQEHLPNTGAGRAGVIAVSEAHTSMQSGSFEQMKYGGIQTKQWLTAEDDQTRESHMLNQMQGSLPIEKRFQNQLMYPGDPAGAVGEIINCRCDLLPGDL